MLPRVNVVRGEVADFLLFSIRDIITDAIYTTGSWEQHMATISRQFHQGVDAPLILDIGANLGGYSVPIAKEIAEGGGVIFAYEPQRIVYYQLCGNLFLNRLDNVFAFNMAIGEFDGYINLPSIDYSRSHNIGGFSIDQDFRDKSMGVSVSQAKGHDVAISRLDNIVLPKSPSLIKMDVEGVELQVLRGGRKFLTEHNFPPILLEAWKAEWFRDKRTDLLQHLENHLGYELFHCGEEVIAQHPAFERAIHFFFGEDGTLFMQRSR